MENILKIILNDMKGLVRNKLAFVLALAVCVLPSLYAWFNIYSNWDPYGNTANVSIAVASMDEGYTDEDGVYQNMGDSVIDGLKENHNINWVFLDSDTEAMEGVEAGEYYAAIVMGTDFSRSMYNFAENGFEHPSVTYYENQKKNAIAAKITDSARGTVQNNINEEFIGVVMDTMTRSMNGIAKDIEESEYVDHLVEKLNFVGDNLQDYIDTLDGLMECNEELNETLSSASGQVSSAGSKVGSTTSSVKSAKQSADSTVANVEAQLDELVARTRTELSNASAHLSAENVSAQDVKAAYSSMQSAISALNSIQNVTGGLGSLGSSSTNEDIRTLVGTMNELLGTGMNTITTTPMTDAQAEIVAAGMNDGNKVLAKSLDCVNAVIPIADKHLTAEVESVKQEINSSYNSMISSLNSMNAGLRDTGIALNSFAGTIDAANISVDELKGLIVEAREEVLEIVERLDMVDDSKQYDELIRILSTDPEVMSEFFSSPVQMNTVRVYEIENYGSGVTPFYTILALWVGATILVSILKVDVEDRKNLLNVKPHELYLGRFFLFFIMGQLQAAIVVLGDIYLLGVQCLEPGKFYLVAVFASFTFNLFVYTMTVSFGDIGKAFAVIVMILQIAGSSGTYPIEILPSFYQKLYIYFPFPYAINAMRETIGGMYQNDYWKYMGQLGIFVIVALVIGLWVRLPFVRVKHYVEKRMRDTRMM